jgi:hypothetical protein
MELLHVQRPKKQHEMIGRLGIGENHDFGSIDKVENDLINSTALH